MGGMKAQRRLRRVLTWISTAIFLAALAVWLLSGFRWFYMSDGRRVTAHASDGILTVDTYPTPGIRSTLIASGPKQFHVRPAPWLSLRPLTLWTSTAYGGTATVALPLALPPAALLLPTCLFWFWPHARGTSPGHCRKCGYDLTGNVTGRCPECGTPVTTPSAG